MFCSLLLLCFSLFYYYFSAVLQEDTFEILGIFMVSKYYLIVAVLNYDKLGRHSGASFLHAESSTVRNNLFVALKYSTHVVSAI